MKLASLLFCVWIAIVLGIFTKNKRQLTAYIVTTLIVPIVCLYIASASNRILLDLQEYTIEVSDKLSYSFSTGDWGLKHYKESIKTVKTVQAPAIVTTKSAVQSNYKTNWNNVYLLPGKNFSFNKLNIKRSYQQLITAARKGDSEAKIQVAMLYMHGVGVEQYFDKAVYWFEQSARDNHPQGQKMYGYTFYGTNNTEAFKYIRKAAQQGDIEAQYLTSKFYLEGIGVAKNQAKSDYWFKKATANDIFGKR
ncbi:tetratricopeptide repeat protein [Vibrio sp. MA40-2]|uniref:tetratricopeptide repeat protein n=1 Tax=Vibrio sp. MA40-2 TaxID=3391828 RepID=UPI0039A557EE